jgi:oligopeptide/dipeptide ABC transporter ATP-binding protein
VTETEAAAPLLEVSELSVCFAARGRVVPPDTEHALHAVDRATFAIGQGEALGLVGESGCGKTTTGRAVVRLVPASAGRIRFDGADITTLGGERLRQMRRHFQIVFQDPFSSLDQRKRVASLVSEPMVIHQTVPPRERRDQVVELLETVGLNRSAADRYPRQLSGGQRQRVAIARVLALDPSLIVLDEAVSALDVSVQAQVINLLARLQTERGLAYLFISHNLSMVRHLCHQVAVMYLGALMEVAPIEQLFVEPRHPYTVALLSALPIPDPPRERQRARIMLAGEAPSPRARPTGCRFHTRCWLRKRLGDPEICRTEEPPLSAVGGSAHRSACHFADSVEA